MRICIVCPRLCHGGAERVAVSMANGLANREHEVFFFTDLFEEQTYQLNETITIMNMVDAPSPKWKKWVSAVQNLRRYIRKDSPDVLIGFMPICSMVSRIASIGTGVPVIATDHYSCERPDSAPLTIWEKVYKFYISRIFQRFTVLTKADKLVFGKQGGNVIVMPNPLVLKPIDTMFLKENVIFAAGRVDNWHVKGFDVLIRAWGRVLASSKVIDSVQKSDTDFHDQKLDTRNLNPNVSSFTDWRLVIAGVWRSPETRTYLDGIAKECGVLDKIEYTGFVADMQKLYAESSIFVLSSRYEGFGLVLIEAMSQGCACIACDYKGRQREILHPSQDQLLETRNLNLETRNLKFEACETGILCEPDNVEALADAIKKMITDDEYRESVRKKAIERSKYYSIENTMDRWEKLLKQVTNNH